VLAELGDEEGFAAVGRLLGAEITAPKSPSVPLPRGRHKNRDPEKMLATAIGRRRRTLPDFERGFVNGDLTFDQGVDLLELLAKAADHRDASLLRTGWQSERRAHIRQLRRRILWPAIPFALVVSGLAARPLQPSAAVWFGVLGLTGIYAAFWTVGVRVS
jgi:hypothetical protein